MAAGKRYNTSLRMAHYLRRRSRDARRIRQRRIAITAEELSREMALSLGGASTARCWPQDPSATAIATKEYQR